MKWYLSGKQGIFLSFGVMFVVTFIGLNFAKEIAIYDIESSDISAFFILNALFLKVFRFRNNICSSRRSIA